MGIDHLDRHLRIRNIRQGKITQTLVGLPAVVAKAMYKSERQHQWIERDIRQNKICRPENSLLFWLCLDLRSRHLKIVVRMVKVAHRVLSA